MASIARLQSAVVHCANNWKMFAAAQIQKQLAFSLWQFYDVARAAKKRLLKLTENSEQNSFTNMIAKIDVEALRI